jgi:hypothetical protein
MLIEAGFDIAFECPAQTPMLLPLSVHPSRDADLLTPDKINCDPNLAMRSYIDHHREGRLLGSYPRRAAFLLVDPSHE